MGAIKAMLETEQGRAELVKNMTEEEKSKLFGNLKSIEKKGQVLADCHEWYEDALEQGLFAYRTNTGWKLTEAGKLILKHT